MSKQFFSLYTLPPLLFMMSAASAQSAGPGFRHEIWQGELDKIGQEQQRLFAERETAFISNYHRYNVLGISIGDSVDKVKNLLLKNFTEVQVRCDDDGCGARTEKESIKVHCISKDKLADFVLYKQSKHLGNNAKACYDQSILLADKLITKYGDPSFNMRNSERNYVTLGWGNVGIMDTQQFPHKEPGYYHNQFLPNNISIFNYKSSGDAQIIQDGFIINFKCISDEEGKLRDNQGNASIDMVISSHSFSEQQKEKDVNSRASRPTEDVKF